jgi:hypothetical protein
MHWIYLWHVYIYVDRRNVCKKKKKNAFALVNTSLDNDDFDTMTKLAKLKGKKNVQQNIFEIEFIVLWLLAHGHGF